MNLHIFIFNFICRNLMRNLSVDFQFGSCKRCLCEAMTVTNVSQTNVFGNSLVVFHIPLSLSLSLSLQWIKWFFFCITFPVYSYLCRVRFLSFKLPAFSLQHINIDNYIHFSFSFCPASDVGLFNPFNPMCVCVYVVFSTIPYYIFTFRFSFRYYCSIFFPSLLLGLIFFLSDRRTRSSFVHSVGCSYTFCVCRRAVNQYTLCW